MTDWLDELSGKGSTYGSLVLVSVIRTQGSCPRDAGTRMLVTTQASVDTIGGGHLEYRAIAMAREMLAAGEPAFRVERFALGARLGQCCGGVAHLSFETICGALPAWVGHLAALRQRGEPCILVTSVRDLDSKSLQNGSEPIAGKLIVTASGVCGQLQDGAMHQQAVTRAQAILRDPGETPVEWRGSLLYERMDAPPFTLAIFGAGHVGKALVHTLAALPCRIDWIDSREDAFADSVPANVTPQLSAHPEDEVQDLPSGSHVVIMTHSHALDQRICEAALKRDDLAWCGLIGSATKRTLFERRLSGRGLDPQALARLTCPIGVAGIDGKHPAEIAIAVAAEILRGQSARAGQRTMSAA